MPRDKSESHIQVVKAMQEEFLEKGFEKASMRSIAQKCGLSVAGLYRHFASKEDMFEAFAKPLVDQVNQWAQNHRNTKYEQVNHGHISRQSLFEDSQIDLIENVIYPKKEAYCILFYKAQGSQYENYLDQFVDAQVLEMMDFFCALKEKGIDVESPSKEELHMLLSVYTAALLQPIQHLYSEEKTKHCLKMVEEFFLPGWINIMKI